MNRAYFPKALLAVFLVCGGGSARAGIVLTANTAGSQSSLISNVTTENFNSLSTGTYTSLTTAVGTLSSPGLAIVAADSYGGAGGTGNYVAVGLESGQTTMTLTLGSAQSYFGFWWSGGDYENTVQFYSNGQLLGTFDGSTASAALNAAYDGNPNNGGDSTEKFAYLNFFGTNGTTIDKIVFTNASTFTGFESDNWSIEAAPISSPYIGNEIAGYTAAPEPSSLILSATGLLAVARVVGRRRFTSPSSPGRP